MLFDVRFYLSHIESLVQAGKRSFVLLFDPCWTLCFFVMLALWIFFNLKNNFEIKNKSKFCFLMPLYVLANKHVDNKIVGCKR